MADPEAPRDHRGISGFGAERLSPYPRGGVWGGGSLHRAPTEEACEQFAGFRLSWGPWCKEDLNRLMPWIDKIWALHPYFPELMGKERTLQGAELLK